MPESASPRNASRPIVVVLFSGVAAGRAQPALSGLKKRERRACVPLEVPGKGDVATLVALAAFRVRLFLQYSKKFSRRDERDACMFV